MILRHCRLSSAPSLWLAHIVLRKLRRWRRPRQIEKDCPCLGGRVIEVGVKKTSDIWKFLRRISWSCMRCSCPSWNHIRSSLHSILHTQIRCGVCSNGAIIFNIVFVIWKMISHVTPWGTFPLNNFSLNNFSLSYIYIRVPIGFN